MMIMGNFKKMYVGAIDKEQDAALLYDKVAILFHGLKVWKILNFVKAKTNYDYTKSDIEKFLSEDDHENYWKIDDYQQWIFL